MKKAFSLIELSISMIVIGLIITAVMSGRDLIKSGESKAFYQTFARKWTTIINSYYDRTSNHLSDSSSYGGFNIYKDGYFDGLNMNAESNQSIVLETLISAGLNPCKLLSTNCYFDNGACNPTCYNIAGEFSDEVRVQVFLNAYIYDGIPTNFIVFHNIPTDIAIGVDRLVDGVADGSHGKAVAFSSLGSYNDNTDISTLSLIEYTSNTMEVINLGIVVEH